MEDEEEKIRQKILVYDRAISILTEFVSDSLKGINQVKGEALPPYDSNFFDLEILAFKLLDEQIQDLQRLRGNYKTALNIFRLHNIQEGDHNGSNR